MINFCSSCTMVTRQPGSMLRPTFVAEARGVGLELDAVTQIGRMQRILDRMRRWCQHRVDRHPTFMQRRDVVLRGARGSGEDMGLDPALSARPPATGSWSSASG